MICVLHFTSLSHSGTKQLESLLKQAFNPLRKFGKEPELKIEIVNKVIDDLPELIPSDFFELFKQLQIKLRIYIFYKFFQSPSHSLK